MPSLKQVETIEYVRPLLLVRKRNTVHNLQGHALDDVQTRLEVCEPL